MRIFLLLLVFLFTHIGCQGSRVSPDDVRKILCSVSPSAYNSAILLCEKLPEERRDACLTAVSIARAGATSLCGLKSYINTPIIHHYYKPINRSRANASLVSAQPFYYQLE